MKRLSALGLSLILLAACSANQSLHASVSPKSSGITSAAPIADTSPASPGAASGTRLASPPSSTPSPLPPAVGLPVQCRLPVYWWDSDTSTQDHAGFVIFPGGQLVEDRSAPSGANYLFFYDRVYAKWIFASRDEVSPDGREYAYAEGDPISGNYSGKLHVVNVATGTDRVIYANSSLVPTVVQFSAEGIYFTDDKGEGFQEGLWLIAPQGGVPRQINSTIFEPKVANGAAWGLAFNAADPDPAPGGITHPYNTILRVDLNTGQSVTWWYQPGNDMRLFDGDYSGNLFAYTFRETVDNSLSDWMLDSRGTAHRIGSVNLDGLAAIDSNGVWFDGGGSGPGSSLWLLTNGQLERVAGFNVAALFVAGGCIPGV